MRKILAILMLLVFLFCIYGALASLEPSSGSSVNPPWLVGYSVVGLLSLMASVVLFRAKQE